jgi:hypothetical protein
MAFTWSISDDDKLVVIRVESEIQTRDVEDIFSAMAEAGALPYRKLVDLTAAPHTLGFANIKIISQIASGAAAKDMPRGPVAFVVDSGLAQDMVEVFDHKMSIDRPLRIFRDARSARQWLDEIAPIVVAP